MKKIEEMSNRELMEELVADKRRQQTLEVVLIAVVLAAAIFVGIKVNAYIQEINNFISTADQALQQVSSYTAMFDSLGEVSEKVNDLADAFDPDTFEQIKSMMNRINTLLDVLHIGG